MGYVACAPAYMTVIKMAQSPFDADETSDVTLRGTGELPWTGERLVPSQTGKIAAEHLHRYAIASALATVRTFWTLLAARVMGAPSWVARRTASSG
jgi:hypothetical protein